MLKTISVLLDKIDVLNQIRSEFDVSFYLEVVPEIYVEDINWDDVKEVLAVVWDKKTRLEANLYSFDAWFKKVSTITGRSYLEYDEESDIIHAPYSNNWECVQYAIEELL